MKTVEVSTKADFEQAVKNNVERIIVTGDLAKDIISAQKKKSVGKKIGIAGGIGIAVSAIAGIALAPVTAGASLAATASAVATSALTATVGGVTVAATTAEVVIAASTILGVAGIAAATINTVAKNYDVKVNAGNTTVECTRKK